VWSRQSSAHTWRECRRAAWADLGGPLNELPLRLLKGWIAVVEEGALGFTIAT